MKLLAIFKNSKDLKKECEVPSLQNIIAQSSGFLSVIQALNEASQRNKPLKGEVKSLKSKVEPVSSRVVALPPLAARAAAAPAACSQKNKKITKVGAVYKEEKSRDGSKNNRQAQFARGGFLPPPANKASALKLPSITKPTMAIASQKPGMHSKSLGASR